MSPTLNDADYILIKKPRSLRAGLIYVINHPRLGRIVKRLSRVENERLWFNGDSPASSSMQKIGPITKEQLLGHAILALTPKGFKRL